ncbi:uncharacterized protein IWZ02DRAFT_437366 [Phyllosticta citriasiana]|uniref:uncharacterized protein n=1 Tax=Phyllosticta citriasiana TaxID=595635 RepID=UPI0030FDB185
MEATDLRVERAAESMKPLPELDPQWTHGFSKILENIQNCNRPSSTRCNRPASCSIPPKSLQYLRERTDNFKHIDSWKDVLKRTKYFLDVDFVDPDDYVSTLQGELSSSRWSTQPATLRMGEDESFSAFKLKVPGLEAALRYDFRTVPDKRIIELRLGHVTPKLVERVQARTKDLQDLKTVKGLFGFIERMEAADQKVAWGRQLSAAPVIQSTASTFDYAYQAKNFRAELECFQISLRGFFRHNRSMQHEIDMLLTSIPRHILFELRRDTRNFKDIETCNDVFKHLSRPGDMCSNGPPGSEDEEPVDRRRRE